jgi:hypothetical protein
MTVPAAGIPEMPLPAGLHENAAVNNPPAEDQLGKAPGGYVVLVFKD